MARQAEGIKTHHLLKNMANYQLLRMIIDLFLGQIDKDGLYPMD